MAIDFIFIHFHLQWGLGLIGSSMYQEVPIGALKRTRDCCPAVFPIELPPLRLRDDNIPSPVWNLISKKQKRLGKLINSVPLRSPNQHGQFG
jgi:hypothetical protein